MEEQQTSVVENNGVENSVPVEVPEENAQVETTQTNVEDDATNNQTEVSSESVKANETSQDTPNTQEDITSLKKQLEEYRLKEEEINQLSNRLGTNNVSDYQIFEANKQLDILDNQAQQAYIALCNQFGVDYRPEKIEASANELKSKDPQAYYDLNYRLSQLDATVNQQRMQVTNFIRNREIQLAMDKYKPILNASPMLSQQLNNYLQTAHPVNPTQDIDMFMTMAQSIQREAFEYGKLFAQQEANKTTQNPQEILNSNSIVQNSNGATGAMKPLTLSDIEKMDLATYSKYAAQIDKLRLEGKL